MDFNMECLLEEDDMSEEEFAFAEKAMSQPALVKELAESFPGNPYCRPYKDHKTS